MSGKRNITLAYNCTAWLLITGCLIAIGAHMFFVYMSGKNINLAKQAEAEIYQMRSEIVGLSAAGINTINTQGAAISHLVVVEPMTVSISQ